MWVVLCSGLFGLTAMLRRRVLAAVVRPIVLNHRFAVVAAASGAMAARAGAFSVHEEFSLQPRGAPQPCRHRHVRLRQREAHQRQSREGRSGNRLLTLRGPWVGIATVVTLIAVAWPRGTGLSISLSVCGCCCGWCYATDVWLLWRPLQWPW